MTFRRYLEVLNAQARGADLTPTQVPATFLFAFVGARIVGRVSIRHSLNAFLQRTGGHVGYAIVPEFRRRGFATEILRQAVEIARDKLGIRRILVTCDDDNIGSIRTIEKNGGVLENVVSGPDLSIPKRRYWIDAGRSDGSYELNHLTVGMPSRDVETPQSRLRARLPADFRGGITCGARDAR